MEGGGIPSSSRATSQLGACCSVGRWPSAETIPHRLHHHVVELDAIFFAIKKATCILFSYSSVLRAVSPSQLAEENMRYGMAVMVCVQRMQRSTNLFATLTRPATISLRSRCVLNVVIVCTLLLYLHHHHRCHHPQRCYHPDRLCFEYPPLRNQICSTRNRICSNHSSLRVSSA